MSRCPDISIITCIWNECEEFFKECALSVASLDAQCEWIICDDGSSHHAAEIYRRIINTFAPNVPVEIITSTTRIGLSRARNAALERAIGQWIVVLDSDDRLPSGLGRMLKEVSGDTQLAAFESIYFSDSNSEHRRIGYFEGLFNSYARTILDPFLWFDFYYHGIIARTDFLREIGGYLNTLKVGEDQDILFRAVESLRNGQVRFIHDVGYMYRNNPAGLCRQEWDAVKKNYTSTMLKAIRRRGGAFRDCRFAGIKEVDGSRVDRYEYLSEDRQWLSWENAVSRFDEILRAE